MQKQSLLEKLLRENRDWLSRVSRQLQVQYQTISRDSPCASVSKRVLVQNVSYETEL